MNAETKQLVLWRLTDTWTTVKRELKAGWWKLRYWKLRKKFINRVNYVPTEGTVSRWKMEATPENTLVIQANAASSALAWTFEGTSEKQFITSADIAIKAVTGNKPLTPEEIKSNRELAEFAARQQEELRKVRAEFEAKQINK